MTNGNKHTEIEMTELDWLIVGELCKEVISPRHEIGRSRYSDPNDEIDEMIQDKIDREASNGSNG
jgi:hypothetical protein